MKFITINYDFTTGKELSYIEGLNSKESFETNVLDFFSFDTKADNVIVLKKDGTCIDLIELRVLEGKGYTEKHIRKEHNIHKMLVANAFKFLPVGTNNK